MIAASENQYRARGVRLTPEAGSEHETDPEISVTRFRAPSTTARRLSPTPNRHGYHSAPTGVAFFSGRAAKAPLARGSRSSDSALPPPAKPVLLLIIIEFNHIILSYIVVHPIFYYNYARARFGVSGGYHCAAALAASHFIFPMILPPAEEEEDRRVRVWGRGGRLQ